MSVELRPFGVRCNLGCQYCYQNPIRDAGNVERTYSMEAMKAAILAEGDGFTLFGGEPLLVPLDDLEELWSWGLEHFGENSVQTNGALITDEHVRLFRKYRVHVGISIDGPGPLNDVRWIHDLAATRKTTARIEAVIEKLCVHGMPPSLIVTLHRVNATSDKLDRMCEWFSYLDGLGIRSVRLHVLETETEVIARKYALSTAENLEALIRFGQMEPSFEGLRFDVFGEAERLLNGTDDNVSCVFRACDPYTTAAVRGVEGSGRQSNCGRTNKEGIDFVKAEAPSYLRYVALYKTPQAYGGCAECRFFLACKGQCPGTGANNDWRYRTVDCELWKTFFTHIEERLVTQGRTPISLHRNRSRMERHFVEAWAQGKNPRLADIVRAAESVQEVDLAARPALNSATNTDARVPVRLDFQLPLSLRHAWVSDEALQVWNERLRNVALALLEASVREVASGARELDQRRIPGWAIFRLQRLVLEWGLALDIRRELEKDNPRPGLVIYDVVYGRESALAQWKAAWEAGDLKRAYTLLGTPQCCIDALCADDRLTWMDPFWPLAQATPTTRIGEDGVVWLDGFYELNPFWRRLGIDAVPHIPCHWRCEATRDWVRRQWAIGRAAGFGVEIDWAEQILGWPVEWSAVHGLGELRTPMIKLATSTDATASKMVLRWQGQGFPAEGVQGTRFPYQRHRADLFSGTESFQRGLDNPLPTREDLLQIRRGPAPSIPRRAPERFLDASLDWSRLAAPQVDGYDIDTAAALAGTNERDVPEQPTIFDGRVAVRVAPERFARRMGMVPARLEHPHIDRGVDLVYRWPLVYGAFPRLVHTVFPMGLAGVAEQEWLRYSGSSSHCMEALWGRVYATIYDPVGFAHALVKEMARTKLYALGVGLGHDHLITNPPKDLFDHPFQPGIRQSMSVLFHAVYSHVYVTALDVRMFVAETDPAMRARLRTWLKRNAGLLEKGRGLLTERAACDERGQAFLAGLVAWMDAVTADARALDELAGE